MILRTCARSGVLIAAAIATSSLGCGSHEIAVEIDFTPAVLADEAQAIELHVVDRCADVTRGDVPTSSRASVAFRRDETPRAVPGVLPERFGVAVLARDASCGIVGAGCLDTTRGTSSLRIEVTPVDGDACGDSVCDDGLCGSGTPMDAGHDAPALDSPAPTDTPAFDGGPDAFSPEAACDCVDDDVDERVDEGCDTEVLWQTPIDVAGREGLRGATLGGDDRVYLNGWMDNLGMNVSLCGVSGLLGTGTDGDNYTVALDATTGACEALLERTEMGTLPRSRFATPQRSSDGMWLFAGPLILELSGVIELSRLELNAGANFDVGSVSLRPGSRDDLLVQWWNGSAAQPTLLGTPVGMPGSDPLVLVTGATPVVSGSTSLPRDALVGWVDSTHAFVVAPSATATGFPCENELEHTSSGPLRVELRDVAALSRCSDAFGVAVDPTGVRERAAVSSGTHVWTLLLFADRYVLVGLDTATGATDSLTFTAPPRPDEEGDTYTHIAAASGGDVVVGLTFAEGPDGSRVRHGVVARVGMDGALVTERTRRTIGDGVAGLGASTTGDVVYATSYVADRATLCGGGAFVAEGTGLLVTAVDLVP